MRVISKKMLSDFWNTPGRQDARPPLEAWYREALHASWRQPVDIKPRFRSASFLHGNRVVFNIAGNKYRLVVKIHYNTGIIYIRFVGTHDEYDKADVEHI